ncbi:MAG TPA: glycosyltransferase family 1 protein [Candidatus Bathyarchaeia archaeon]|nr:glycosyltransferase family 1 protein [Candidatus Bathyarchaeia archaeon]
MTVVVNAKPLMGLLTGIARYVRALYTAIAAEGLVPARYYYRGRLSDTMPEQRASKPDYPVPSAVIELLINARMRLHDAGLRRVLRRVSDAVYHETELFPLRTGGRLPTVLTIYDLSLIRYPEHHPPEIVRYFERHFHRRLGLVDQFIAISEFVRAEVVRELGIAPERVAAVPLAADSAFRPRPDPEVRAYLERSGLPGRYLLYVGTLEPRKNLVQVIRAMSAMKKRVPLVCAGWAGWQNDEFEREVARHGLAGDVLRIGRVSDQALALLYSGARCLVYPSLYEGFGLPLVEAMACGCPVVCSDRASLPEVAGGAAILVPVGDDEGMAASLERMVNGSAERSRLVACGLERARSFSWRRTAEETVAVFRRLGGE